MIDIGHLTSQNSIQTTKNEKFNYVIYLNQSKNTLGKFIKQRVHSYFIDEKPILHTEPWVTTFVDSKTSPGVCFSLTKSRQ